MYKGEIDYECMNITASVDKIMNEITNQLHKKGATGITLNNNTIKFNGGFLSGIIFNWCLLTGITKGNVAVENNKIKYSLSFLETYIFFGFLVPFVYLAMLRDGNIPLLAWIFPVIFLILIIFSQEFFGYGRFRKFLKKCILRANEKSNELISSLDASGDLD